jgi:hypothetical protein
MRDGAAPDNGRHLIVAPPFSIERTGSGFPFNFLGNRRPAPSAFGGKFEE